MMATTMPGNTGVGAAMLAGGGSRAAVIQQQQLLQQQLPPSLFDVFYEDLITKLMKSGDLMEKVQNEFMQLQTDIERVEYLLGLGPMVSEFEVKTKVGLKSIERSNKHREEGNKLFQADQTPQAILQFNKSLVYAPHPDYEEYCWPLEMDLDKNGKKQYEKKDPGKYEALATCYANRSAALRKLCQYEDCLRDIARAARFGYPKENMYKLWERKAKCYQAIKRYDMAAKCLRQALQVLKEASLNESQKTQKTNEYQTMLKEATNTHMILHMGTGPVAEAEEEESTPLMGATGPMVFVPEPPSRKKSTANPPPPPPPPPTPTPIPTTPAPQTKPERKKSIFNRRSSTENGNDKPKYIGGSYSIHSRSTTTEPVPIPAPKPPTSASPSLVSNSGSVPGGIAGSVNSGGPDEVLHKATSQISISQLSGLNVSMRPDNDVPDLSYGINSRMPSASLAIDLKFSQERGRYFVAVQDLLPGDVILREEPYAAVLEPIFRVNHCSHCLRKTSTPIPCFECATVQYCCETCRDAGWNEYHRIECGILAYLEPSRFLGKMPHLALRIITKTGLQSLIQHTINGSTNKSCQDNPDPSTNHATSMNSPFDPTNYRSVHDLATNVENRSFEDLMKKTAEAIFMAKCLKFNGFFGDRNKQTLKAEIFVGSLLLRHLQIAATNGLEMSECIMKNNDLNNFDIIPVGGAIFPTISFFNHSCYPNALRLGYQSYQVVRVIRTIRRGDEVTIDYGFDFYANPLEERQRRAYTQYHFECKCMACVNNWPVYNDLLGKERNFKVALGHEVIQEVNQQSANYQLGMEFLLKLDIPNAMPIFKSFLIVMNELVEHPDQFYVDCEEAYKQCLWLENRGFKAKLSDQNFNLSSKSSFLPIGIFLTQR